MKSFPLLCAIISIVLSSCLPLCQNVNEGKKNDVLEGGDDTKHIPLWSIREADRFKTAEGISERAGKKKGNSVPKKTSDDKPKKKAHKKKSQNDLAISKTTLTPGLGSDVIKDKNIRNAIRNGSRVVMEALGSHIILDHLTNADETDGEILEALLLTKPPTTGPDGRVEQSLSVTTPHPFLIGPIFGSGSGASSSSSSSSSGKGSPESGNGSAESGKGSAESGKGSAESGKGSSENGKGSSESGKGSSESGKGSSESGKGSFENGKGSGESDKGELGKSKGSGKHGKKPKTVNVIVNPSNKKGDSKAQKSLPSEEDEDEPKVNVTTSDNTTNIIVKKRSMNFFME